MSVGRARVSVLSIGTAVPERSIAQEDAASMACAVMGADGSMDERSLRLLYRRAGVERRGSVLADERGVIPAFGAGREELTTGERMALHRAHAADLACAAAGDALARSGVRAGAITHLVTASCTGFDAPGADQAIVRRLGLRADVRRTHIGFMGCHAAVNALAAGAAFARSEDGARVLVCCAELCTLHFARAGGVDAHVANALFADGAAAAVLAAAEGGVQVRRFASAIIPGTEEMMSWRIADRGFEMRLSASVPEVLAREVPGWVDGWLGEEGLARGDVGSWAIHPGGPKILNELERSLGLAEGAAGVSREVLAGHGNMSSATVLFLLSRLLEREAPGPIVALAFGPGLAGEGMLVERV